MKKYTIALLALYSLSTLAAESCPQLAGTFTQCTTGDIAIDKDMVMPKKIEIKQSLVKGQTKYSIKFDVTDEELSFKAGVFTLGKKSKRYINFENSDFKVEFDATPSCKNKNLVIDYAFKKLVFEKGFEPTKEEREILTEYTRLEIGTIATHTYSLKKDTLILSNDDLPAPIKCKKL